ncbi:MAG: MIP/aquaporin family protein [Limisphaerales bacterium]
MRNPVPRHWPEYLMEGGLLGLFMISAAVVGVLLNHPESVVGSLALDPVLRRVLGGLAMGVTAVVLIHTPWGRQSGAHFNPAVTLSFWSLGRMRGRDVLGYLAGQFAGGFLGLLVARAMIGRALGDEPVQWVVTVPGSAGAGWAAFGEFGIAFLHFFAVLALSNYPRLSPFTGWIAGLLVATWIVVEGPLSGMSMNPARTFASALPSGIWTGGWIYFTAPVLGMLAAGFVFSTIRKSRPLACPKLIHSPNHRCIFCGHRMAADVPFPSDASRRRTLVQPSGEHGFEHRGSDGRRPGAGVVTDPFVS